MCEILLIEMHEALVLLAIVFAEVVIIHKRPWTKHAGLECKGQGLHRARVEVAVDVNEESPVIPPSRSHMCASSQR